MTVAIAFVFIPIAKLFVRLKRTIETELAARHATAELNDMSDYMLRDLGITRGDIEHVVRRPCAWTGRDERPGKTTESIVPGIAVSRRSDAPVRSAPPRTA